MSGLTLHPTSLDRCFRVEFHRHADNRGWFHRLWDDDAMRRVGAGAMTQSSLSHNRRTGTLRGMHWQAPPAEEWKLVVCVRGRIFDVAADIRSRSSTRGEHVHLTLEAGEPHALLIGPGLAHGFQTLEDHADVLYFIDKPYAPGAARGCRYDDSSLAIPWPLPPTVISDRDLGHPPLEAAT